MGISLKGKNSRWVSSLDVGVLILMIHGDLVLLEEIADRETEACVVVHGANGLFL
jgi:hypothetical protein